MNDNYVVKNIRLRNIANEYIGTIKKAYIIDENDLSDFDNGEEVRFYGEDYFVEAREKLMVADSQPGSNLDAINYDFYKIILFNKAMYDLDKSGLDEGEELDIGDYKITEYIAVPHPESEWVS